LRATITDFQREKEPVYSHQRSGRSPPEDEKDACPLGKDGTGRTESDRHKRSRQYRARATAAHVRISWLARRICEADHPTSSAPLGDAMPARSIQPLMRKSDTAQVCMLRTKITASKPCDVSLSYDLGAPIPPCHKKPTQASESESTPYARPYQSHYRASTIGPRG